MRSVVVRSTRCWYFTQPTVAKLAEDLAKQLKREADRVAREIEQQIREEVCQTGGIAPRNVLRHPPVHRGGLSARIFQTIRLVNRGGLGVDRIYEVLLRLGKDVPRCSAGEAHVHLVIPLETDERFALFVAREEREGQ